MSLKYEDKIDNFLLGKMTPDEEKQFIEDCKSNKQLKEEAIMMACLVKSLQKPKQQTK